MRRYAVLGPGAIGGLYGGMLAAAGHPVTFVARSDADALRERGLRIDSVWGDLQLAPGSFAVATDPADVGPVDVVVVALKTTANAALPRLLPPLLGPSTTVVVLQNGLGVEAEAEAAAPGAAAVLGGMCFTCSLKVGPAHIDHVDHGLITLGRATGSAQALDDVAADLAGARVQVQVVDDLVTARWRKLLWNVPYNGLSVVLGAGADWLSADPVGRQLVLDVMGDVVAGAVACGAALTPDDAEALVAMTARMVPYRSSMALDFDARRPLEHAAIHGAPAAASRAAGRPLPLVEALHRQLDVLDRRNRADGTRGGDR